MNTYGYVGNDPLAWVDPFGLEVVPATAGGLPLIIPNPTPYGSDANKTLAKGLDNYVSDTIARAKLIWFIAKCIGIRCLSIMHNENADDESSNSDSKQCDDNARQKGDRFKDGDSASDQYEGIQREQNRRRKQGDNTSIESINKSKQRDKNALKPWNIDY